jgi:uncharacterized protein
MSRENVGIVRAFFEAYLRGDYDEALSWLAPDVVYQVGQEVPAQGPEAVRAVWERWESDWEELETIPEEYLDGGDRVVVAVYYSGRGRASRIKLDDRLFEVYTLRHGKCVRKAEFRDRSDALEAAGRSEWPPRHSDGYRAGA